MTTKKDGEKLNIKDILDDNISQLLLSLEGKIRSGEFKISLYGLGHVGSPIAAAWLRAGAHVIGVDKSKFILEYARQGKTSILYQTMVKTKLALVANANHANSELAGEFSITIAPLQGKSLAEIACGVLPAH